MDTNIKNKVQLITYPNSLGKDLKELNIALNTYFNGLFPGGVHILPPFPSSGDRGFAPVSYLEIEKKFGDWTDIESIGSGHDIILDLMVNHISRQSVYFQDFIEKGPDSEYADMFLTLDKIWRDGEPVKDDIDKIFLRRELPYSVFDTQGAEKIRVWTTFGKTNPSEQIDVDINSGAVRKLFEEILNHFSAHGVKMIRLDAVGYAIKKMGTSCFFVEPEIYWLLNWISEMAKKRGISILPEVHAHYSIQYKLAANGFPIYDFILPYRILEALLIRKFDKLGEYLRERPQNQFTMLDCHDGLPIMPDLNDMFNAKDAQHIVDICLERGANLSRVHSDAHKLEGGFDVHQVRGTIYSLLGEDDDSYIIARALQFFTPGIPQVYYVGLLAGTNKYECADETGDGREINRYNYSLSEIEDEITREVVQRMFWLIHFRNSHPSFDGDFVINEASGYKIELEWHHATSSSRLCIDLENKEAFIEYGQDGATIRQTI